MRIHVAVKTWLIQRNGSAIGTVRAAGRSMVVGTSFEANINSKPEMVFITNVLPDERIIEVK
jgi:hypothetical protein